MTTETEQLQRLITGMRTAYAAGENVMAWARETTGASANDTLATLIAYDLQTGSYTAGVRADPQTNDRWCAQLAVILAPFVTADRTLMEVGCGEATTLAGVLAQLPAKPRQAHGFDLSWSRCQAGLSWLADKGETASLFVGDLFGIPLGDESVDVVYTSHSLEPNGGREEAALRELLRVARHAVVLIEPLYELAGPDAQARMLRHGYVRNLKTAAERLGARVTEHRLLDFIRHTQNPAGLVLIEKTPIAETGSGKGASPALAWRCPLTHTSLRDAGDTFVSDNTGIVYPVMRGIPMLRGEHAVVASQLH
jgi:SAM-dependent methyltransferase